LDFGKTEIFFQTGLDRARQISAVRERFVTVIASEAKQSISRPRKEWIASSLRSSQ
jgi:hypothetical protein